MNYVERNQLILMRNINATFFCDREQFTEMAVQMASAFDIYTSCPDILGIDSRTLFSSIARHCFQEITKTTISTLSALIQTMSIP